MLDWINRLGQIFPSGCAVQQKGIFVAIIVRIVSADGSKTVSKVLPALPSHLKVPQGAKVDVVDKETGVSSTLMQYINKKSSVAGEEGKGSDGLSGVTVETVADWGEAIAWLDAAEQQAIQDGTLSPADVKANASPWYDPGTDRNEGSVLGFDRGTLLIGGAVGAGLVGGALLLKGDDKTPKDTIPPAAPVGLDLAVDDDTGALTSDNLTSKTSGLTISGTAEAGSKVELFNGTTSLGVVTAGANGAFTLDIALVQGAHSIRATATDLAGNTSTSSAVLSITVDTTAPAAAAAPVLSAASDSNVNNDGVTNKTSVTITGTITSNGVVTLYDGETLIGTLTPTTQGAYSLTTTLTEGTHSITAKITDAAGNISAASPALAIVVDTTVPAQVTNLRLDASDDNGASTSDGITSIKEDLTFTGVAEVGSTVSIYKGTSVVGTGVAGANGLFSIDIDLAVGTHDLFARASDLAGNISPSTAAIQIQIIEPTSITSLLDQIDTGNFIV